MPLWLPPIEIFKPLAQAAAVTLGVFLGWSLNGRSQRRDRIRQVRAEWAAAGEQFLGAHEADIDAWYKFQAETDPQASAQKLAERQIRTRELHDATAKLRAATLRLLLVGPGECVDVLPIEAALLGILRFNGNATAMHPEREKARGQLRAAVQTWIGRGP